MAFILPCTFAVVGSPAALQVIDSFRADLDDGAGEHHRRGTDQGVSRGKTMARSQTTFALAFSGMVLALVTSGCVVPNAVNGRAPGNAATIDADGQSYIHLAEAARDSGDLAGAVRFYQKACSMLQLKQQDIMVALADVDLAGGAVDDANAIYAHVLDLDARRADAHFGLGRAFLMMHKPNQAEVEFSAATAIDPRNVKYLNDDGVALDSAGRHKDAQAVYQTALAVAPDDNVVRNNLGLSLALSGAYDDAVAQLSMLTLERGATPRMRQNLALALGLKGDAAMRRPASCALIWARMHCSQYLQYYRRPCVASGAANSTNMCFKHTINLENFMEFGYSVPVLTVLAGGSAPRRRLIVDHALIEASVALKWSRCRRHGPNACAAPTSSVKSPTSSIVWSPSASASAASPSASPSRCSPTISASRRSRCTSTSAATAA